MRVLGVIIPAAGRSTRFGAGRNKLLENLAGRPVIAYAVRAFLSRHDVASVVVPTSDAAAFAQALGSPLDKRISFCAGGPTRAHSVYMGLQALGNAVEWVAIHDAARPLVSQQLIDRTLRAAMTHGAAVPALPVSLTIKQAPGPLPSPVQRTVPRDTLWAMQTPQIMRRESLLRAFARCPISLSNVTDDAQLLESIGEPVWLVPGEEQNLKITTELDLWLAEIILERRQPAAPV